MKQQQNSQSSQSSQNSQNSQNSQSAHNAQSYQGAYRGNDTQQTSSPHQEKNATESQSLSGIDNKTSGETQSWHLLEGNEKAPITDDTTGSNSNSTTAAKNNSSNNNNSNNNNKSSSSNNNKGGTNGEEKENIVETDQRSELEVKEDDPSTSLEQSYFSTYSKGYHNSNRNHGHNGDELSELDEKQIWDEAMKTLDEAVERNPDRDWESEAKRIAAVEAEYEKRCREKAEALRLQQLKEKENQRCQQAKEHKLELKKKRLEKLRDRGQGSAVDEGHESQDGDGTGVRIPDPIAKKCHPLDRARRKAVESINRELPREDRSKAQKVAEQTDEEWGSYAQFILATVGFLIGLGNIFRFPFLAARYGGGSFLFLYLIFLALLGIPLFMLEIAIGRTRRAGAFESLRSIHPRLGGLGITGILTVILVGAYYSVVISWAILYFFNSFQDPLPWDNEAIDSSLLPDGVSKKNVSLAQSTEFYWENFALELNKGAAETGELSGIVWPLFGTLLLSYVLLFASVAGGVQTTGKVVYGIVTLPFVLMIVLVVRGATLDGAGDGLVYFFRPTADGFKDGEAWRAAAQQVFYSTGVGWGVLLTYASYSKPDTDVVKDTVIVFSANTLTSILMGAAMFMIAGHLAKETGEELEDFITGGPGLVFVVTTQALVLMPGSAFFSVLFFLMLILLGFSSQVGNVHAVTSLMKDFGSRLRNPVLAAIVCGGGFLFGLFFTTSGGFFWFDVVDTNAAALSLFLVCLGQTVGVAYVIGYDDFAADYTDSSGFELPPILKPLIMYVAPVGLLILTIVSMVALGNQASTVTEVTDNGSSSYIGFGIFFAILPCLPTIIVAIWPGSLDFILKRRPMAYRLRSETAGKLEKAKQDQKREAKEKERKEKEKENENEDENENENV